MGDITILILCPNQSAVGTARAAQLTTDHTGVQAKLDRGEITSAEARIHPQRHYITRALGGLPTVDYDYDLYDSLAI